MDEQYWEDIQNAIDVLDFYGDKTQSELSDKLKTACREMSQELEELRLELDQAISED